MKKSEMMQEYSGVDPRLQRQAELVEQLHQVICSKATALSMRIDNETEFVREMYETLTKFQPLFHINFGLSGFNGSTISVSFREKKYIGDLMFVQRGHSKWSHETDSIHVQQRYKYNVEGTTFGMKGHVLISLEAVLFQAMPQLFSEKHITEFNQQLEKIIIEIS